MKEYRSTNVEYEEIYDFDEVNGKSKDSWYKINPTQVSRPKYTNDVTRLPPIDPKQRPVRKAHGKGDEWFKTGQPNVFGKTCPHPPSGPVPRAPDHRRREQEVYGLHGRRPVGKPRLGPELRYEQYMHDSPAGPRPKFVKDTTRLPSIAKGGSRHTAQVNYTRKSGSYNACRLPDINHGQKALDIDAEYAELMAGHDKEELENNPWVKAYEEKNGLRNEKKYYF